MSPLSGGFSAACSFQGKKRLETGICSFRRRKSPLYAFAHDAQQGPMCCCWMNQQIISISNPLRPSAERLDRFRQRTLLFVSHDHEFIQTVNNRIIEITPSGVVDRAMTYDEYLGKRAK